MTAWQRQRLVLKRIAESVREGGLLVFVFGLLDEFQHIEPTHPVDLTWVAIVAVIGVGAVAGGILAEWALSFVEESDS